MVSLFRLDGQRAMSLLVVAQERPSYHRFEKKIHEHKNSQAHKEDINILETANKDVLLNLNAQSEQAVFQSTARVFRTAYYVAKNNKPFTDFESLIDLQEGNSLDMGRVLHSKTVAVDIIDHVFSQMKKTFN